MTRLERERNKKVMEGGGIYVTTLQVSLSKPLTYFIFKLVACL